jgi:endonuclease YncB( thermonuclease family)
VARVEAGGGDLGALLIRRGHAWHYERYAPGATEYARLERQARNANRGLWSRAGPVPPWDWRDGVRNRKRGTFGIRAKCHHRRWESAIRRPEGGFFCHDI